MLLLPIFVRTGKELRVGGMVRTCFVRASGGVGEGGGRVEHVLCKLLGGRMTGGVEHVA